MGRELSIGMIIYIGSVAAAFLKYLRKDILD